MPSFPLNFPAVSVLTQLSPPSQDLRTYHRSTSALFTSPSRTPCFSAISSAREAGKVLRSESFSANDMESALSVAVFTEDSCVFVALFDFWSAKISCTLGAEPDAFSLRGFHWMISAAFFAFWDCFDAGFCGTFGPPAFSISLAVETTGAVGFPGTLGTFVPPSPHFGGVGGSSGGFLAPETGEISVLAGFTAHSGTTSGTKFFARSMPRLSRILTSSFHEPPRVLSSATSFTSCCFAKESGLVRASR